MTTGPRRKREPSVSGPFVKEDGSRYWTCRVDSRGRITIPKEILREQDWRAGDRLELEVWDEDGSKSIRVRNIDALARKGTPDGPETLEVDP
jgi:AbrB family looped-hinge helix DNA binding protein